MNKLHKIARNQKVCASLWDDPILLGIYVGLNGFIEGDPLHNRNWVGPSLQHEREVLLPAAQKIRKRLQAVLPEDSK